MEAIQYIGVNELSDDERDIVNKLSTNNYERIKRALHNMTSVKVHVKLHDKNSKTRKYSVHAQAIAPTTLFEASSSGWDLAKVLHNVFEDLEKEIHHRLHNDTSYKKPYA